MGEGIGTAGRLPSVAGPIPCISSTRCILFPAGSLHAPDSKLVRKGFYAPVPSSHSRVRCCRASLVGAPAALLLLLLFFAPRCRAETSSLPDAPQPAQYLRFSARLYG
jgi:hypothetical protein